MKSKPEILAPVGSREALTAAVRAGADAVYFGSEQFNARRNADNFSKDTIKEAIDYCRLNGVKCYLTLNTLIKDGELKSALDLVDCVWQCGIDAVIVQDLGLALVLHKSFPKLNLHASTQLSIHSPAALPLLKEMGFTRVVTAREMSRKELTAFCKKAAELEIEVETFIHGALCMCLSGQCYFSAYLGGRSANRGLCAGTCRLPFSAKGGTGYDLSLKDLSLIPYLNELALMGVSSFKIEGRMKRPEYVACSVHAVRQMVDKGFVDPDISELLVKVFSRDGFTDGYYTQSLGSKMFGIRSEQDKQLSGEAISKIHELYRRERQRLPLLMDFTLKKGEPAVLKAECNGVSVTVTGAIPEQAVNRPLNEERVSEALSKLGGTCYYAENITHRLEEGLMLPASALNSLRKSAVEKLNAARICRRQKAEFSADLGSKAAKRSIKGFFARFATLEQCFASAEQLPYLGGYSLPAEILASALQNPELTKSKRDILTNSSAELARGAAEDNAAENILTTLKEEGITSAVCSNLAALNTARETGLCLIGGFGLNLFNSLSLESAKKAGVLKTVISPELSLGEIDRLNVPDGLEALALCYGRQPLMLTRNCPVKNGVGCKGKKAYCELTDRKNRRFPVVCRNGFCEILNCKTTDISDCLDKLSVDTGYLYFTTEAPEKVNEIISEFRLSKAHSGADFTRGLFKSGVL